MQFLHARIAHVTISLDPADLRSCNHCCTWVTDVYYSVMYYICIITSCIAIFLPDWYFVEYCKHGRKTSQIVTRFLPLDGAIASRAVIVIVSGTNAFGASWITHKKSPQIVGLGPPMRSQIFWPVNFNANQLNILVHLPQLWLNSTYQFKVALRLLPFSKSVSNWSASDMMTITALEAIASLSGTKNQSRYRQFWLLGTTETILIWPKELHKRWSIHLEFLSTSSSIAVNQLTTVFKWAGNQPVSA